MNVLQSIRSIYWAPPLARTDFWAQFRGSLRDTPFSDALLYRFQQLEGKTTLRGCTFLFAKPYDQSDCDIVLTFEQPSTSFFSRKPKRVELRVTPWELSNTYETVDVDSDKKSPFYQLRGSEFWNAFTVEDKRPTLKDKQRETNDTLMRTFVHPHIYTSCDTDA